MEYIALNNGVSTINLEYNTMLVYEVDPTIVTPKVKHTNIPYFYTGEMQHYNFYF